MGLFDMLSVSASALSAERQRAEVTSANLANAETTHTDTGGPYVRKEVVFSTSNVSPFSTVLGRLGHFGQATPGSVQVAGVVDDTTPPVMHYEPGNPDADKDGYVKTPNVDLAIEFVNSLEASRAYEANVTMMDTAKSMINSSLRLLA